MKLVCSAVLASSAGREGCVGQQVDDTCGDGGGSGVEHMEAPGLSWTNDPYGSPRPVFDKPRRGKAIL